MSKIKKSWGFIKKEYRGCFENVFFQIVVILQIIIVMLSLCRFKRGIGIKLVSFLSDLQMPIINVNGGYLPTIIGY